MTIEVTVGDTPIEVTATGTTVAATVSAAATVAASVSGGQGPQGATGAASTVAGPTGATGATGSQGIQGATGSTGAQGDQGIQGVAGDTGAAGAAALWNFTGVYSGGAAYAVGDVATYGGATWYRINSNGGNVGDTPAVGSFWSLLADQGATGLTGAAGPQGIQGATGPQGDEGEPGPQGVTGDEGLQGITGDTGLAGPTGSTGAAAVMSITSASSNTIGIGGAGKIFTFTATPSIGFAIGQRVRAASTASPTTAYVEGVLTTASSSSVTITSDVSAGSGTLTAWTLSVSGERGVAGATGSTGATGSSATATTSASDLTSGTLAAARLPAASTSAVGGVELATSAETLTRTSEALAVTPYGLGLSTRGGGRAKFWEAFNDFNFDFSGNATGTDGFSFGTYFIGTGASLDLYSNKSSAFASQPTSGIATLTTGTTATGSSSFYSYNSHMPRFDNGTRVYETLIYIPILSTAVEEYLIRIGNVTGGPIGGAAIMVAFEYNRLNSVNWMAVTANNGVFTRTDTGVAVTAATWTKLAFAGNSTSIAFSIGGAVLATNTTNIRADGDMRLGGNILKSAGTTARTFLCDYVYTRHDFTGSR